MSKKNLKTQPQETYSFSALEVGDLIEVDTSFIEVNSDDSAEKNKTCYLVLETRWKNITGVSAPIFTVSLFKLDSQRKLDPVADFTNYFSIKLISKGTDVSDKNSL